MAHDSDSYVPGPLDQFVPGLRRKAERWPALPVHPRVVHARAPGGDRTIVLASFAEPVSVKAFHAALKPLIEAALLAELSRPGSELVEDGSELVALELYMFHAPAVDVAPMLTLFGFRPASLDEPSAHGALALLRREAQLVEGAVPEEAVSRYQAVFARSSHPLYARLVRSMRELAPRDAWGTKPGALARACADQLTSFGYIPIEPTREGIERLEAVIVPADAGVVRWLDPLLYQALCDLVAVAATVTFGRAVQWGVCEPDEETTLSPPPVLLAERDGDTFHVPLGEHVLGWCVMPRFESETIPTLGAWAEHEFS
ncbi:MAG: hypothetical protein JWN48_2361 [Myxococcaceae bacterium]|nr:hypothetical protein [Myxococcaceae bacterium]